MKYSTVYTLALLLTACSCSLLEPGNKINVTADKRIAGINESIRFGTLTPVSNQIYWTFEGNKTQRGNQVSHRFSKPGTYWVKASLKKNGMSYKELKIIVTGEVIEEGGMIISEPTVDLPADAVFDYQIMLSSNEIKTNEFITISTDADSDFEWDLDDGKNSQERSMQINYQRSGRKLIKLKMKSSGQVVNTAFITVIEPDIPASDPTLGDPGAITKSDEIPAYIRNFPTLTQLTAALNQLANADMGISEKRQLQKQIIEDCLDGNQTPVVGSGMSVDDYLKKLYIEASQYETIQLSLSWEIDDSSNKIKIIIIN